MGAHVLVDFPRAELVFTCVDQPVEKRVEPSGRYEELRQLKALLDDGIVTQSEYEREKGEILSR